MLQTVIMFMLELQYIDSNLANETDEAKLECLAEKLKIYEYRALNLFRGVDLDDYGSLDEVPDNVVGMEVRIHEPRINEEPEEEQAVPANVADDDSDLELSD